MTSPWLLLADVGGTNVRFGRSAGAQNITDIRSWPNDAFDGFESALETYLATLGIHERFSSVVIAVAGPAAPDAIALTNNDWVVTSKGCRRVLGYEVPVRLMNDLEAVAYALPHLSSTQVNLIDAIYAPLRPFQRMLAVNVGTGFGTATIIRGSGRWECCPAESGHMDLAIRGDDERALMSALGYDSPSIEDIMSGDGVRRLWAVLSDREAENTNKPIGGEFDFAGTDPASKNVLHYFSRLLARAASNLVLSSTAWGGVYFCGSVATAWFNSADHTEFRRAFTGTGKMSARLARTPIGLIRHELPAFVGLAHVSSCDQALSEPT